MDALDKCRIHYCMLLTGVEITASGHVQIAFAVKRLWIRAGFIGSGALEGSKRSKGQKIALHHPKGHKRLYPGTLFPKGQVCRCIFVGDLNCDLQDLSAWKILQDCGWMDSAILQKSKDGIDPLPTWSSYSRIDFILLPPALVPFFRFYTNSPDTVSDHSEISVTLAVAQEQVHRHMWKPCRDMRSFLESDGWHSEDFQGIDWSQFHQEVSAGNVEGAYKSFFPLLSPCLPRPVHDCPLISHCNNFKVDPTLRLCANRFTPPW